MPPLCLSVLLFSVGVHVVLLAPYLRGCLSVRNGKAVCMFSPLSVSCFMFNRKATWILWHPFVRFLLIIDT